MTSPRSTYSGGYYASPSFPDTPIYDSLVAERGTPQIAPIRVNPSPWDTGSSSLPALPSALPALPAAPSQPAPGHGYPGAAAQPVAPLQHTPAPYIPQQAGTRGYPPPQQQYQRPAPGTGYEAMRPAAPVAPRPGSPFDDPGYGRQYPRGY
ncbi:MULTISPECIES: DUF6643 family protein [Streptomyces]|uniref:Uncharacterized protein n=1 Tax=Streptomyces yunnanensis TaxID=156453 RepID=A0ABY8AGE6_9ACTN|nr:MULTISPECIES: DUF6643 family protein [Streptomyces]AJC59902.1 hypothetical protein GZL_07350 [Streptomyces sp. 769]WEB43804.1 hypothetical protein MOV08_34040 [Streptomyces yunnanensis]